MATNDFVEFFCDEARDIADLTSINFDLERAQAATKKVLEDDGVWRDVNLLKPLTR